MKTWVDRLRFYAAITSPARWFDREEDVEAGRRTLRRYFQDSSTSLPSQEDLWQAEKITAAAVNPESNSVLPAVTRRSFFAPVNCLVYVAQFIAGGTWQRDVFWQLCNQTYNAYLNHVNGSDTSADASTNVGKFGLAIFGSCSATLGARFALQRGLLSVMTSANMNGAVGLGRMGPTAFLLCSTVVPPLIGNLVGNYINLFAIRKGDLEQGIPVRPGGSGAIENVGRSVVAAETAFRETVTSRSILIMGSVFGLTVLPSFLLPQQTPLMQDFLAHKTRMVENWVKQSFPRWSRIAQAASLRPHFPLFLSLYMGFACVVLCSMLPLSLSPYKYYIELDAYGLEPEIAAQAKAGKIPRTLYAYRGL